MSKDLPKPLKLKNTLGPSFILLGLALGSGELILWPYLAANHGLGLLWGALIGITFQFILNTEIMRYSLAWGESIFVGFKKLFKLLPYWFILSTFIPWSLPGFSSASSQILSRTLNLPVSEKLLAVFLLLFTGLILSAGRTLYKTMEVLQRTVILIGLPLIAFLALRLSTLADWQQVAQGLIGKGDGWWFFPSGIALASFLGAFAYSGAGGNLNLSQSYYVKEKGLGMGKYAKKIISLFAPGEKEVKLEGETFQDTQKNQARWQKWWKLINREHFLVFWTLGFITIILLSLLAKTLTFGSASQSGITFLYQEATQIRAFLTPTFSTIFLLIAALMLFSTQLGVLESSSRIISENILLISHKEGEKANPSKAFYIALWAQIGFGIATYLLGFQEPRLLLTLAAVLNAAAMMVSFPLVYLLNRKKLSRKYQPRFLRKAIMAAAFTFFAVFLVLTVLNP